MTQKNETHLLGDANFTQRFMNNYNKKQRHTNNSEITKQKYTQRNAKHIELANN